MDIGLLWRIFLAFLSIGAVSFGGGYSMIPVMERIVVHEHGWLTLQTFTDAVAVAGMSPGPIAVNSAVFIGFSAAGFPGAAAAALGMVLPSLTIILIVAAFFYKVRDNEWIKRGFYGLRPIITGLIFYAAINFALGNGIVPAGLGAFDWKTASLAAIFLCSLAALIWSKTHPALVLVMAGLVGAVLFS